MSPEENEPGIIDWEPSDIVTAMWVGQSILLGVLAFLSAGLAYALFGAKPEAAELSVNWLVVGVATVGVLLLHQFIHAGFAWIFGAAQRVDLDVIHWVLPVVTFRVDGHEFSRWQFLFYSLGPFLVPALLVVALMPFEERTFHLIFPLAINAGFSVRDVWMAQIVWRQPAGTIVEIREGGLRMVRST